jgi:hypothetical protein
LYQTEAYGKVFLPEPLEDKAIDEANEIVDARSLIPIQWTIGKSRATALITQSASKLADRAGEGTARHDMILISK